MTSKMPAEGVPTPNPPNPPKQVYGAKSMVDLEEHIKWTECEVKNAGSKADASTILKQGLRDQKALVLTSDADEQLLIHIAFTAKIKLHSIQVDCPEDGDTGRKNPPKGIKLFLGIVDFDAAEGAGAYEKELSEEDFGKRLEVPFVKFQSVDTLTLFVHSNQNDEEETHLSGFRMWGAPRDGMAMSEFKRVAGEAGEGE